MRMFHLGKTSRSGAPGLWPGRATWRNTARFTTFVLIIMMIQHQHQHQHQHHLFHVLLLVEVDPVLVGGAHGVQGQEDVAWNLELITIVRKNIICSNKGADKKNYDVLAMWWWWAINFDKFLVPTFIFSASPSTKTETGPTSSMSITYLVFKVNDPKYGSDCQ